MTESLDTARLALATELPPRSELIVHVRAMFMSVGAEQLTMKILRAQLNAIYHFDLKPFSAQLSEIVSEVMAEPAIIDVLALNEPRETVCKRNCRRVAVDADAAISL